MYLCGFSLSGLEFGVETVDLRLKLLFLLSKFVEVSLKCLEFILVYFQLIFSFYREAFQLINFVFLLMSDGFFFI